MTELGLALVKHFEGCRLTAYKCPGGVWTIGYGHTKGVKSGDTITIEQAEEMLVKDLAEYELNVRTRLQVSLNDYQVDALTSFTYNVGIYAFSRSTLLYKVNHGGTEEEIRKQFSLWNKANGKVLEGLKRRREAEANLYFTPYYGEQFKCDMK